MSGASRSRDDARGAPRRRHTWSHVGLLAAVFALLAGILGVLPTAVLTPSASAAGPTYPPPANTHVLTAGQIPTVCTQAEFDEGASAYSSNFGVYWSETAQQWRSAPWCYPRWGFISMTPSQIINAGDTVTMTVIGDDPRLAGYVEQGFGGWSWSHPGTVVSGCGTHDMSCTVKVGSNADTSPEWRWSEFHVSGPGRVFILPPSYAPRCQPDNPCIDTNTNAWSWVGLRPASTPPTADFTYTVDGGTVSFHATSTDPVNSVLFHEWNFGDGHTGTGVNPAHTYTKSGDFPVTLKSTNTSDLSDSVTKNVTVVAEPLEIKNVKFDPAIPVVGKPAKATFDVVNNGEDPVTGVVPTAQVTPPEFAGLLGSPTPSGFTLAAGASTSVTVNLDARKNGEAFLTVGAGGTYDGAATTAKTVTAPFDVAGPSISLTTELPAQPPKQGDPFDVKLVVKNVSDEAVNGVLPTLTVKPTDRVDVGAVQPSGPISLAPAGQPGDSVTFTWSLKAERTAKVDLDFAVAGQTAGGRDVSETKTDHVDLDAKLTFTWEIEPYVHNVGGVLDPAQVTPTNYDFKVIVNQVNGTSCSGADRFVFQADGVGLPVQQQPGTCIFSFQRPNTDKFTLTGARVVDDVIDSIGEGDIEARDFFIVSVGDSLSSGEGSSAPESPIWTLFQCHRSNLAGPVQATKRIEDEDRHSVVTFLHLGCSGGSTKEGLTGEFRGIQPGEVLPPQIPEIARFADGREIDAVVISVGANDFRFGEVIEHCLTNRAFNPLVLGNVDFSHCQDQPMTDKFGNTLLPTDFMNQRVAEQPALYARVDSWLKGAGVSPDRVFMFDYPNSTRDQDGHSCTAVNSASSMTEDEWLWNEGHVAYPLNNAVGTAIATHGWQPVTGFGPLFERHGYCTTDRWITTLQDSIAKQGGVHGAFHPNPKGHELYRDRIAEALHGQLFVNGEPRPAQQNVESPTLLADDTKPGDTKVPVKHDHFQIGDKVVIDPGTGAAEVVTIVDKGSLIFDHPLAFAHRAGTLIVLDGQLPGALDLVAQPIPAQATTTTTPTGNVPAQATTVPSPSSATLPTSSGSPSSGTTIGNTSLPTTGYDPRRLASLAIMLLGAGGIVLWFRRRRTTGVADLDT